LIHFYKRIMTNKVIRLNVGGVYFVTTLSTLQACPNSTLAAMFSPSSHFQPAVTDETGAFFLDTDPVLFGFVLNWCRNGHLPLEQEGIDWRGLEVIADYFGIEEMKEEARNQRKLRHKLLKEKVRNEKELIDIMKEKMRNEQELIDVQKNILQTVQHQHQEIIEKLDEAEGHQDIVDAIYDVQTSVNNVADEVEGIELSVDVDGIVSELQDVNKALWYGDEANNNVVTRVNRVVEELKKVNKNLKK